MKFLNTSLLFLLLPYLASARLNTQHSDNALLEGESRMLQLCTQCKTVYVAVHLLIDPNNNNGRMALWTDAQIADEIANLNVQYKPTPFRFELLQNGITRTFDSAKNTAPLNQDFFLDPISKELRMGDSTTVNIFINDGLCNTENEGWAKADPNNPALFPVGEYSPADSVSICGDAIFNVNPFLMTHEIGHWLGLKHTFDGDTCDPNVGGDGIDDTPQQSSYDKGCNVGQDTCPGGGVDPINNWMDYSTCPDKEFTPGQIQAMYDQYTKQRVRPQSCGPTDALLEVEVKFDANPSENRFIVTTWGAADGSTANENANYVSDKIDYTNKLAKLSLCIPRNTMREVKMRDQAQNGIQSPGYFKYKLNGADLYEGGAWSGKIFDSVLVAGDSATCASGQGRFTLQMKLDGRPSDISWEIKNASGQTVVDQRATTTPGRAVYVSNFIDSGLIFDQCLNAGTYTFIINDIDSGMQAGFYSLSVNGKEVRYENAHFFTSETTTFSVAALPDPDPGDEPGDTGTSTPTPAPTPAPTRAPTRAPTGGGGFPCFSGSCTVEVLNQGTKMLKDVKLGDLVQVGKNSYEPVYSFGHFNVNAHAEFLEIKTDATALQITRDHMVFLASGAAVPATMVKVGDELVDASGDRIMVKSIKSTSSMGIIAPFTPSGTIVVDGVLASSFVAFEASSHLTVFGMKVSYQWMAHSFEFPHRLFCNYLTECLEETYDEDGVSTWVSTPRRGASWMMEQGFTLKNLLGLLMVCLFVVFNAIEYAVLHPVSACAGAYFIWKIRYRCGSKKA